MRPPPLRRRPAHSRARHRRPQVRCPRRRRLASRRRSSKPRGSNLHRRWDPKIFDEALKDYFDNKQEQAARKLYAFIESTPPTDENFAWAQYFLARCLIDLGLRHAGAVYLRASRTSGATRKCCPRRWRRCKVLTEVPHDEVMIDEQVFGSLDLGFLPEASATTPTTSRAWWTSGWATSAGPGPTS